ncbi:MAG: hypothetical protein EKK38_18720 [Hyphomicrobium sp.]|nr:MAG: hypothetical protein EKK38_18720 [Hyphomicrobium sp.]
MRHAAGRGLEQFQQKCATVLRPELRQTKRLERFRDSRKSGNALGRGPPTAARISNPHPCSSCMTG